MSTHTASGLPLDAPHTTLVFDERELRDKIDELQLDCISKNNQIMRLEELVATQRELINSMEEVINRMEAGEKFT